jgi:hypothetical protein
MIHEFKRSPLIGSDRCAECGEVRTHDNHAYVSRSGDIDMHMMASIHNIPDETIQLIKGVALILVCEKIAESQPPDHAVTGAQLVELWVRNAIKVLADEGVLKIGKRQVNPEILGPELVQ